MSNHPLKLALHFILELVALFAFGYWGFTVYDGILEWLLGIGVPVIAAAVWGIFRSVNDGGRGDPVVKVPGIVRLLIEALFFGGAAVAFYSAGQPNTALIFGVIVVLQYATSWDQIGRLLRTP